MCRPHAVVYAEHVLEALLIYRIAVCTTKSQCEEAIFNRAADGVSGVW